MATPGAGVSVRLPQLRWETPSGGATPSGGRGPGSTLRSVGVAHEVLGSIVSDLLQEPSLPGSGGRKRQTDRERLSWARS